jgi:hypothetical protein
MEYNAHMFTFAFLGLLFPFSILIVVFIAIILAFEIAMFISVMRNEYITGNARILWVLGMLLIHPIVAIAYYFTDYHKVK